MPMKACPGVRLEATSAPTAFCLTDSMNVLMTGSATSASSSATRTSRKVSPTFSSVMRPRPRRESMVRPSRAVRLSNMGIPPCTRRCRGGDYSDPAWTPCGPPTPQLGGCGQPVLLPATAGIAASDRGTPLNSAPTTALLGALLLLLLIIAFSSGTEVAMLSVNRYRVKHRAQQGQGTARILERLLQKPDDWLGANLVILAAASSFASAIATILAQRTNYPYAVPITVLLLTVVVIVFCELTPKIYAATHPESVA